MLKYRDRNLETGCSRTRLEISAVTKIERADSTSEMTADRSKVRSFEVQATSLLQASCGFDTVRDVTNDGILDVCDVPEAEVSTDVNIEGADPDFGIVEERDISVP